MGEIFDKVLDGLINSGPIGMVLAISLWDNWKMKKKLFEIIEQNIKSMTQVVEVMRDVKEELTALRNAQDRRRAEFE